MFAFDNSRKETPNCVRFIETDIHTQNHIRNIFKTNLYGGTPSRIEPISSVFLSTLAAVDVAFVVVVAAAEAVLLLRLLNV